MADSFSEVMEHKIEGRDYQRVVQRRGSDVVLLAPHAGGIEPGTGKLVQAIAGETYSYYMFDGLQEINNRQLHVPSTNFDDPLCLDLVRTTEMALSLHGCRGFDEIVYVGGLQQGTMEKITRSLTRHGFRATHDRSGHAGHHPQNICNRCASGKGVQLELSHALRKTFFKGFDRPGREHPTARFTRFVLAIRNVL